jgi:hypothetical protein
LMLGLMISSFFHASIFCNGAGVFLIRGIYFQGFTFPLWSSGRYNLYCNDNAFYTFLSAFLNVFQ